MSAHDIRRHEHAAPAPHREHGTHQHRHEHGSRLSRAQRIATHAAAITAWSSGVLWLLFHYFFQRQGEFALEPHPLEHWWLRLHGLCAFVLLWLGGVLWALHVRPGMRWPQRRRSGLVLSTVFCLLAATGYLRYYADDGTLRDAVGVIHWVVGLALALPLALHFLPGRQARRRARVPADAGARVRAAE